MKDEILFQDQYDTRFSDEDAQLQFQEEKYWFWSDFRDLGMGIKD